jgi:hypothetical protein
MDLEEFKITLKSDKPPAQVKGCLAALWYDGNNDWESAHTIAQDIEDKNAYRVHAYLHRKEGDRGNADYWYRKAGLKTPDYPLEKEWEELVNLNL